jgi:hypothetical protein
MCAILLFSINFSNRELKRAKRLFPRDFLAKNACGWWSGAL